MSFLISKKAAISNKNLKLAGDLYEGSFDSNKRTVLSIDVAGDSQGKGYQVAQGIKHMMHKKWLKKWVYSTSKTEGWRQRGGI